MKNPERRAALDKARKQALLWAEKAEHDAPLYGPDTNHMRGVIGMSMMWSEVAEAMKVGDERADNV